MFYSQCLISSKGVLRPIWIAAYFYKKLKKDQVSQTNISSSVDEIMLQRVTVSYRVLGYLLLGVVRIFSKKVEYLHDDCDQIIDKMKSYVLLKSSKEGKDASDFCISLPEKFELDQFILDLPESFCDKHIAPYQQITLKERFGDSNNGLFSFDKFHEDQDLAYFEANIGDHTPVHNSLSPHSEVNDTMMQCSHLPLSSEDSTDKLLNSRLPPDEYSDTWIGCEAEGSHFDEFDSPIHFAEPTPPGTGKSCVLNEEDPLADIADGTQKSGLPVDIGAPTTPDSMANCTPAEDHPQHSRKRKCSFEETLVLSNKSMGQSLLDPITRREAPNISTQEKLPHHQDFVKPLIPCAGTPKLVAITNPGKEEPVFSRKRKCVGNDTTVLSNEVMLQNRENSSDLVVDRRGQAPVTSLDVWKAYKLPQLYQDFLEPLIPCAQELKAFYKIRVRASHQVEALGGRTELGEDQHATHRKPLEDRVLSSIAPEGVIRSAECVKTQNEPSQERDYTFVPSEGPSRSDNHQSEALKGRTELGEDQHATQRKPLEDRVLSSEAPEGVIMSAECVKTQNEPSQERDYTFVPSEGPSRSDNHQSETRREPSQEGAYSGEDRADDPICNLVEPPTTSMEVPTTSAPGEDGDQSESEYEYIKLDLADEEEVLQEDTTETESGWSVRTSSFASLLRNCFANQREHSSTEFLNMAPILEETTRKENARTFYEILVLKSRGYVDVKQDTPYGDICLLGTPKLRSTFTASRSFL